MIKIIPFDSLKDREKEEEIHGVYKASIKGIRGSYSPNARNYLAESNSWRYELIGGTSVLALDGDRIIGFAKMGSYGSIDMLYVRPKHQKQGAGTQLLAALETEAQKRGLDE